MPVTCEEEQGRASPCKSGPIAPEPLVEVFPRKDRTADGTCTPLALPCAEMIHAFLAVTPREGSELNKKTPRPFNGCKGNQIEAL